MGCVCVCVCVCVCNFIYLFIGCWSPYCFYNFVLVNVAAIIMEYACIFCILIYTPSDICSRVVWWSHKTEDKSIFSFLRNLCTDFHKDCTILHSYEKWMRVPLSPYPCQHLLFFNFLMLVNLIWVRWNLSFLLSFPLSIRMFNISYSFLCLFPFYLLIYSSVHTLFGTSLPTTSPPPPPASPLPLPGRTCSALFSFVEEKT
jgi:hypothetical protein